MSDSGPDLTPQQITLLGLLLAGRGPEAAAVELGVSARTVYRWLRDPAFIAEYTAARRIVHDSALDVIAAGARRAAGVLVEMAHDTMKPPAVRLRAADAILGHLRQWRQENLEERVAAIEATMGGGSGQ